MPPFPTQGQPFMSVFFGEQRQYAARTGSFGKLTISVTIAVPGQTNMDRALMQYYHDTGFEVALLLDLADGSGGEKATKTLQGALTIVSEATGILECRSDVL